MRQVLPSLLKNPHRGQESSICESGKGDEGGTAQRGFSFVQVSFLEVKFSKTNSSHIDDFCPRRADSEEEGILIAAPQKVSARRGKSSSDGPRCTVNRGATPPGVFREQRGRFVANRTSCATFFRPISPFTTAWGILLRQSPRSAQSKLDYSEKWQRTTRPVDHEVAGVWDMAGMWAGSGDSSRFAARPLAPPTSAPPSRAAHALLAAAGSCASPRLRVGQMQGDSSHLVAPVRAWHSALRV